MRDSFYSNLPPELVLKDDPVERRLLMEYGSVFVARAGVRPPTKVVFRNHLEVEVFQSSVESSTEDVGGFEVELQSPAMDALVAAVSEASELGLAITPRGEGSAKRSYDETVGLWKSRVEPALVHWVSLNRLSAEQAEGILAMEPFEQVPVVLRLEEGGIFFAKDLSKSILYSVAPPGASQHLSMLAFDVSQFGDARVRSILARNRWYQTVVSDRPHFTFLGVDECELPSLGLKRMVWGDQHFWIPDLP